MMFASMPAAGVDGQPLRKFLVKHQTQITASRDSPNAAFSGGVPPLSVGTIVNSDAQGWSANEPTMRVRVIIPNALFGHGFMHGWVDHASLSPLTPVTGEPLLAPTSISYAMSREVQDGWEHGYSQLPVQIAIAEAIAAGTAAGKSYRESCDEVWMRVRGPVLARFGFAPGADGLAHFLELPRDYTDDDLGEADYVAIKAAHNRIVQLMVAKDPAKAAAVSRGGGEGDDGFDEKLGPTPEEAAVAAVATADAAVDAAAAAAKAAAEEAAMGPMTRERLEDLQMDACAMDVPIEDAMLSWTAAQVVVFFESGGEDRPE